MSNVSGEGGDALRAEVIESGVTNLTFNEKGFLKLSPAESTAFHRNSPRQLGTVQYDAEPIENGCKKKNHKNDREVREHIAIYKDFLF
ncbi:MAG: hypothetical protein WEB37_12050 [Bacteroidota bacterium]